MIYQNIFRIFGINDPTRPSDITIEYVDCTPIFQEMDRRNGNLILKLA